MLWSHSLEIAKPILGFGSFTTEPVGGVDVRFGADSDGFCANATNDVKGQQATLHFWLN